ncbi:putative spermidine/putrescine transport system ATP-binding protein [Shimia isoporae]|uniref:Spermidine/putrescine import ATP-binding protein PotA n=1 Tax=Shimia isoporae TaxID=647720 RepID=A0A4R1N0Y6_9RHOB|nr:ABC transporter ATP-binding protein [Shimia isoporae]TCK99749.1 putative spermidine/putrescine transport system ATP-binding protein [Shimia isoporae]
MQGSRVRFENVTKSFGATVALSDFNLDIAPGEFVTLLGASGSGKSTALNILAGFSDASSGEVFIDDRPLTGVAPEHRNVGMVFQSFALFPHKTVADNVAFPLKMRKVPQPEIDKRVKAALEMVRLGEFAARKPAALSGGQRQRVALARAVVFEPPVLLMDECLSALDLKLREELQGEIRRIHREIGTTVLFVTHDQTEALTMSDRIAILEGGKIEQIDAPEALYDRPRTRFVADFIGQSNMFSLGDVKDGRASVPDMGIDIPMSDESAVAISLRPERIRVVLGEEPADKTIFEGVVQEETFFGPVVAQMVRLTSGRLLEVRSQRSGHDRMPHAGEAIKLAFDPADAAPLAD